MSDNKLRYIMYLRKSSDNEDRQVQSIPDQKKELEPLVANKQLNVIKFFGESQSAKKPGRSDFNEMLQMIEEGKADGIICWKINRLARNPIDGGRIQWLLQQGIIKSIITPGKEYLPTDNVLMMAVELGVANQFILDLSKDVKRGMKTKFEKGWKPVKAPLGWLNDPMGQKGEKKIFKDHERFPVVRKMWDLLLTGMYTVPQILTIANNEWGFRTKKGYKLNPSTLYKIFTNPFYYGEYLYEGEIFQGKHEPMVTKEEFDLAQKILGKAGKPRPKEKRLPFNSIITCGECGCMITSEEKLKFIKSENKTKAYLYHHCTKKKLDVKCTQRSLKYEELVEQVQNFLDSIVIPPYFLDWAIEILRNNNRLEEQNRGIMLANQRKSYDECLKRIDNLINIYIAPDNAHRQLISEEEFKAQKNTLIQEKTRIQGEMRTIESNIDDWLEVTEKTFHFATYAKVMFEKADYEGKTKLLQLLGQNFTLINGKLEISAKNHFAVLIKGLNAEPLKSARLEPDLSALSERKNSPLEAVYSTWSG